MTNYFVIPTPSACDDVDSHALEICLPIRRDCTPTDTDTLLAECSERWNCNLCAGDSPYFIPYEEGDKIMIQTLFTDLYNTDPTNPTSGWGNPSFIKAELFNYDGNFISEDHTTFASRYLVGWNGKSSYQLLELDTALIAQDCFYVRITAYDSDDDQVGQVCTQEFAKSQCTDLIELEGMYDTFDGLGNYYGSPTAYVGNGSFKYTNKLKVHAYIHDDGGSVKATSFNSNRVISEITHTYKFVLTRQVPPFVKNLILKVFFPAKTLYFSGEIYKVPDDFSIENQYRDSRMFFFESEIFTEAEADFRCN